MSSSLRASSVSLGLSNRPPSQQEEEEEDREFDKGYYQANGRGRYHLRQRSNNDIDDVLEGMDGEGDSNISRGAFENADMDEEYEITNNDEEDEDEEEAYRARDDESNISTDDDSASDEGEEDPLHVKEPQDTPILRSSTPLTNLQASNTDLSSQMTYDTSQVMGCLKSTLSRLDSLESRVQGLVRDRKRLEWKDDDEDDDGHEMRKNFDEKMKKFPKRSKWLILLTLINVT
jgi:hypothetical protein